MVRSICSAQVIQKCYGYQKQTDPSESALTCGGSRLSWCATGHWNRRQIWRAIAGRMPVLRSCCRLRVVPSIGRFGRWFRSHRNLRESLYRTLSWLKRCNAGQRVSSVRRFSRTDRGASHLDGRGASIRRHCLALGTDQSRRAALATGFTFRESGQHSGRRVHG
jgi:hypothetical protein